MKGSYVLFIRIDENTELNIGALGPTLFNKGEYCYAGSAMNGLSQRLTRHMRKDKKIHWHIDHLTTAADEMEAFFSLSVKECELRRAAQECGMVPAVKGFGCSDCKCDTHLLLSSPASKQHLIARTGLERFLF